MAAYGNKAVCKRCILSAQHYLTPLTESQPQPYLFYDEKMPYDAAQAMNEANR